MPTLPNSVIFVLKRNSMSLLWALLGVGAVLFGIGYLIGALIMLGKSTRAIKVPPKIKTYFRENPGVTFIVIFQVLLLVCAGLLISGNSLLAEGVAIVAYSSLVIGVFRQLISFVRHAEEEEGKDNDR